MSRTRGFLSLAVVLSVALPCAALDFLSPEEEAELELERRREAEPVLACAPPRLTARVKKDATLSVRLTVLNAGGRTLHWSVRSAPGWAAPDARSGKLGFEEKAYVVLAIDPSSLPEGTAEGEVVIEAPGAKGSPVKVPILVEVLPVPKPEPVAEKVEEPTEPAAVEEERAEPELAAAEPEPPAPAGVKEEVPRERAPLGLGVRAGVMLPGTGEKADYSTGLILGLFWRPERDGSRLGYEIEIGYRQSESESGLEESTLVAGHANGLWHFARNEVLSAYAVGGLGVTSEQAKDEELGTSSVLGSTVDVGAGLTMDFGLDVRITYSFLLGSENVGGALGASLGYVF